MEEANTYSSTRNGKRLYVDNKSGYWRVVSDDSSDIDIRKEAISKSVKPIDIQDYNKDIYTWEVVLYLTNKCNFSCGYCYSKNAREANWKSFDMDRLKKIIQKVMFEPSKNSINFLLFGGESFAAFDQMKRAVEFVLEVNRKCKKKVSFSTTTNGSLLNKEKVRFLMDYGIRVGISLDGPEHVHNKHRRSSGGKNTYSEVIEGVNLLKESGISFGIISTIDDPDYMMDVFDYFIENQYTTSVKISPFIPEGSAKTSNINAINEYASRWGKVNLECAKRLIEHNKSNSFKLKENNLANMISHLILDERPDICLRTPCAAGFGMIEFHPDGSIVTCDKTLYSPELGVVANIDEVSETISLSELLDNSDLIKKIRSRVASSIPKCAKCPVQAHCGGACTLGSYDLYKSFYREDVMCNYRRYMFEELMWLIDLDPKNALHLGMPNSV